MGIRAWKGFLLGLVMCATGTCGGEGVRLGGTPYIGSVCPSRASRLLIGDATTMMMCGEGQMRSKTIVCDNKNHTYLKVCWEYISSSMALLKDSVDSRALRRMGPSSKGL